MSLSKREIINELWRRGELVWKLDVNQKALYDLFYKTDHKIQTWLLARRSGKTYTLLLLSLEQCIKHPNSIIKFVSPTKLQLNTILRPLMNQLLEDCPEDVRPVFRAKDYIYYFKNGSEIQLAGSESGHAEKLRGGSSHISIVDEAGDVSHLDDIVKSILLPTTLTTGGRILIAGTPPKAEDHDFVKFIEEAELKGSLVKRIVTDNPRLDPKEIENLIEEMGGRMNEKCRRELFCELIKDSKLSVIPEFDDDLKKQIIREWEKPPFFDAYEAMDLGFKDLTVVLFAYYDFKSDKVVIEDEVVFHSSELQLPALIERIKDKEFKLWFNHLTNEYRKPSLRVSDINYMVTQEINRLSNGEINFLPARKDDNDAALNTLRVMLANKKIIIHPRCTTLIRHLTNVKWSSPTNKNTFGRSPDDGHYDAVDAIKYLIRHIAYGKNPYPNFYNMETKNLFINNPGKIPVTSDVNVLKAMLNIKRK